MIAHWAFAPFQVGGVLRDGLESLDPPADWSPLRQKELPESRVGSGLAGWALDGGEEYVYLNRQGFGLAVERRLLDVGADLSPQGVVALLEERRRFHRRTIEGAGRLPELAALTCAMAEPHLASKKKRPDIFEGIPYVLSMYIIDSSPCHILSSKDRQRSLLALIEPSLIGADDDPAVEVAPSPKEMVNLLRGLRLDSYAELLTDYDLVESVSGFMSWAGVVVVASSDNSADYNDSSRLYRELEVRTQLAWAMSYYARCWCDLSLNGEKLSDTVVEEVRFEVAPIVRQALRLNDASVHTRTRRLLDGLNATSGLPHQLSAASEALSDLEAYVTARQERQRRRYNRFVEVALALLATTQIVPLLFDVPVVALPRDPVIGSVVVTAIVAIGVLIGMRDRR